MTHPELIGVRCHAQGHFFIQTGDNVIVRRGFEPATICCQAAFIFRYLVSISVISPRFISIRGHFSNSLQPPQFTIQSPQPDRCWVVFIPPCRSFFRTVTKTLETSVISVCVSLMSHEGSYLPSKAFFLISSYMFARQPAKETAFPIYSGCLCVILTFVRSKTFECDKYVNQSGGGQTLFHIYLTSGLFSSYKLCLLSTRVFTRTQLHHRCQYWLMISSPGSGRILLLWGERGFTQFSWGGPRRKHDDTV